MTATETGSLLASIPQRLGIESASSKCWSESGGVHWLDPNTESGIVNVRVVAQAMNAVEARFVTITAYELAGDQGFRLEYHWDLNGLLLGFPYVVTTKAIDSIYDLCEAVDWIEREIYEGFTVEFTGREYEPLLLRQGDAPGINLREVAK